MLQRIQQNFVKSFATKQTFHTFAYSNQSEWDMGNRVKQIEIAKEHKVEIVENKPLARMLFANVEVGEAVPPELYQAVAEVLAFVYHLQGKV